MQRVLIGAVAFALLSIPSFSSADIVPVDGDTAIIEQLGFNTLGVAFDPPNEGNASGELINGVAYSGANVAGMTHDNTLTYSGLDLDGDATPDSVTFTLSITNPGPGLLFNQGFHTNWGTIDGMAASVTNVSGTTSDGSSIVFDGFTGAALGAGNGTGDIDRTATLNGISYALSGANSGVFEFVQQYEDFAPTPTLAVTASGGTVGTFVLRNVDLQFSGVPAAIPEPSSLALLGLAGSLITLRRRK